MGDMPRSLRGQIVELRKMIEMIAASLDVHKADSERVQEENSASLASLHRRITAVEKDTTAA